MNATTAARYSVQRQAADGGEWFPVSACNSVAYARILATVGLRRQIGVCYRLIDNRTGAGTVLFPVQHQKAA
jgi:hypothetical protein